MSHVVYSPSPQPSPSRGEGAAIPSSPGKIPSPLEGEGQGGGDFSIIILLSISVVNAFHKPCAFSLSSSTYTRSGPARTVRRGVACGTGSERTASMMDSVRVDTDPVGCDSLLRSITIIIERNPVKIY